MDSWPIGGDKLRAMYAGGRADATARRFARLWAFVFCLGLAPRRWVTLEVAGRRSGRPTRFPLGMADLDGRWYLVPMLGERCNWVRNVRAADGMVTLRHGRAQRRRLAEVPVSDRPLILKQYLQQVPGARPHIPVSQHADPAAFTAIAAAYPVFLVTPDTAGSRPGPDGRRHGTLLRRRWWRWILAGVAVTIVVIVAAVAAFIKLGPSASPLVLPAATTRPPAGRLDGTWQAAAGSLAGFRVRESALGVSNYVGGQTTAVTGTIVISGRTVTAAALRVNVSTVKVGGKVQPQFAASLGIRHHPVATFSLTRPVTLSRAFASGGTVTATAKGQLTMNGSTHRVTLTFTARRNGPELQTAGSIPVSFAPWGIRQPTGFGLLGSLASHGDAEFLIIFNRR